MCILLATENPRAFAASSCRLELPSLNKHSNGESSPSSQMIFLLQLFLANSAKLKAPYTFCSALPVFILEIRSHNRGHCLWSQWGNFPACTMQSSPLAEMFRSHWTSPIELQDAGSLSQNPRHLYDTLEHPTLPAFLHKIECSFKSFLNFQYNLSGQAC